jgi:hypothetical protein
MLIEELLAVRNQIASAAQEVYDAWDQDEDGIDIEVGGGGICDEVQSAISDVIASNIECDIEDGGWEGDDHANLIISRGNERYLVDIPARVYETGGGMNWRKIPDVNITTDDIIIVSVD